jgi:hypothetical protein
MSRSGRVEPVSQVADEAPAAARPVTLLPVVDGRGLPE